MEIINSKNKLLEDKYFLTYSLATTYKEGTHLKDWLKSIDKDLLSSFIAYEINDLPGTQSEDLLLCALHIEKIKRGKDKLKISDDKMSKISGTLFVTLVMESLERNGFISIEYFSNPRQSWHMNEKLKITPLKDIP